MDEYTVFANDPDNAYTLAVQLGNLKVYVPVGKGKWFAGFGAKVIVDGEEVKNLRTLTIRIAYDQPISTTLETLVRNSD